MKHLFKGCIAIVLTFALLMGMMPYNAFAADGETVLTSISHSDAISSVDVSGKTTATLTVPYDHGTTIDLSKGLDIAYDKAVYSSAIASFSNSVATVDGGPVDMLVTYQTIADVSTTNTTTYSVNVVRKAYLAPTFSGSIAKTVTLPAALTLTAADFEGNYAINNGKALDAISINGSNPSCGSLQVDGSDYNFGDLIKISDLATTKLTFAATDQGEVNYTVTAYEAGNSQAVGTAVLKITVKPVVINAADIAYTSTAGAAVTFNAANFINVCTNASGEALSYVKFVLPSTTSGKLYYNYVSSSSLGTAVSASDSYYAAASPDLSKITFVPYSGYSGTVPISYTAYTADGHEYNAKVQITVTASSINSVTYNTDEDAEITLDSADFNTVCNSATGDNLSYVKFTLPSSSYGKLYYDYTSASSYDSKVAATTKYYRSSTPDLDNVTFVPYTNYDGTVTISYTGYSTAGESYTGKIKITVGSTSSASTITYTTDEDEEITFDSDDFNDISNDETGEDLSYVKFTLPSTSYGKLYYDYTSSSSYDSKVAATTKYYRSDLDDVTFVPYTNYNGTVTISYTGYNTSGDSFTGKIKITVGSTSSANAIDYTTDEDVAVTFDSADFNTVCNNTTSETLSYVKFTLPSTSYGKLYYAYTSSSSFGTKVAATTKYYRSSTPDLDNVTFVPYTGYTGTVTINYTGYNVDGDSFTGTVKVKVVAVTKPVVSKYFSDVDASYTWAAPSINYLYTAGVVEGTSTGKYSPAAKITRGDFMLMLYRALKLSASTVSSNFTDVPKTSYYYTAIGVAKTLGIAQGSGGYFRPAAAITREDAMALVARALKVSGVTLPTGSISNLSSFTDKGSVSTYAISSVGSLVSAKIITGDGNRIYPKNNVTRAEMAVILYRVLQK